MGKTYSWITLIASRNIVFAFDCDNKPRYVLLLSVL